MLNYKLKLGTVDAQRNYSETCNINGFIKGEILKHEGCLIQTCENHLVRESLSEECIQFIQKIVEGKLEKKLCEKGTKTKRSC